MSINCFSNKPTYPVAVEVYNKIVFPFLVVIFWHLTTNTLWFAPPLVLTLELWCLTFKQVFLTYWSLTIRCSFICLKWVVIPMNTVLVYNPQCCYTSNMHSSNIDVVLYVIMLPLHCWVQTRYGTDALLQFEL